VVEALVEPEGFHRLAGGFLATRANPNTRAAYGRDLADLAAALGVAPAEAPPPAFGVEEDPAARRAAEALSALPAEWWRDWRDGLAGRASSRRRRVAAARAFCR